MSPFLFFVIVALVVAAVLLWRAHNPKGFSATVASAESQAKTAVSKAEDAVKDASKKV